MVDGGQGEVIMVLVIMLAMVVEVVKKAVRWSMNLAQAWDTN